MNSKTHRPTQLVSDDQLMSASDFARHVRLLGVAHTQVSAGVRQTTLSPSLLADLDRFEHGTGVEPLDVLAACIRHGRPLVLFLELAGRVLSLRLFPAQALFACTADMLGMPEAHVRELRFVRVEPGVQYREPEAQDGEAARAFTGPLPQLLWRMAMRGHRWAPLPEIDGRACYRVSPVLAINLLPADDAAAVAVLSRLKRKALALDDIAAEPGMGIERACRLLNAVYLQAGLITLRSAPAARYSALRQAHGAARR